MPLVAGVDSSTQSTKVELRDLESGRLVGRGSAPHPAAIPPASEQDPRAWWAAFERAFAEAEVFARTALRSTVDLRAIAVAGQQHGMVALDAEGEPVHPAKLWNDTESAADAAWLIDRLGGPQAWADAVGSVPVAAFTATKLSWLHRTHPAAWARMRHVVLPHDYLGWRLTGRFATDRGDASGTGYWSPTTGAYHDGVLDAIDAERDWIDVLPEVLGPLDVAGTWRSGARRDEIVVGPGTGDNMAAALGVGLRPGDAVVSIGTSGTVYTVADAPTADPTGAVAGFADATGRFLPLVCTSNAAKVLDAVARLLGVDHAELDRLAADAPPGGPILLPYLDGERTPSRPDATGVLAGLRSDVTRSELARAAVDGVACGLLDAYDALGAHARVTGRVLLVGGGSRSRTLRRVLAAQLDRPIAVSDVTEAVATGAAVQAAAVVDSAGFEQVQERWGLGDAGRAEQVDDPLVDDGLRDRYGELRDRFA